MPVRRGPQRGHGRNVFADIASTLANIAQVAAAASQQPGMTVQARGGYGAGAEAAAVVDVPANPVWLTLTQVLNEVPVGFQVTGTPLTDDQRSFLKVVEHLSKIANALSPAPNDPALLAEFQEVGEFLGTHPDSQALNAFISTHPSLVTVAAPAGSASTGWLWPFISGIFIGAASENASRRPAILAPDYGVGYAGADDDWRALYDASTRTAEQVSTLTIGQPAPVRTEIVGPSIHRDRASGTSDGGASTGWGPGLSPYDLYYPPTYVQGPDGNLWPAPVGA